MALGGIASDKERTEEAKRVLEWGLGAFESRQVFADAGGDRRRPASTAVPSRSVDLVAKTPVSVYIPVNNPERLAARIVYRWPLTAPGGGGSGNRDAADRLRAAGCCVKCRSTARRRWRSAR